MSIDTTMRERILRAVEDVRKAAAKHNESVRASLTASVQSFPAQASQAVNENEANAAAAPKLHLMLAKPHRSIW